MYRTCKLFYKKQKTDFQNIKDITPEDKIIFEQLKKAISVRFLKDNPVADPAISSWKGQDIVMFQEELLKNTNGRISEKSFYSYFKNDPKKLPRIDILNMLSEYCGYRNWNDFKAQNQQTKTIKQTNSYYKRFWIPVLVVFFVLSIYALIPRKHTFSFCFIDADRNHTITNTKVDIIVLNNQQSPFYQKSDSLGCFHWSTTDDFIHFVVKSPYYKTDTIYRTFASAAAEPIEIRTDDYALMLHYYANGNVADWKKRRKELDRIIDPKATIFEILPLGLGIEVYSKDEFINKLTTPTQSLKAIEIIESVKSEGRIIKLKFRIKS